MVMISAFTIRDVAISIGITILFPLIFIYGIKIFMQYPSMRYSSSTYELEQELRTLKKEGVKEEIGRMQKDIESIKNRLEKKQKEFERVVTAQEIESAQKKIDEAKENIKKQEELYRKVVADYEFRYMLIFVIAGLLAIFFGMWIIEPLGSGLMFGGVFCIVYGLLYYWWRFGNMTKFFVLLSALLMLLMYGYFHFIEVKKYRLNN